MACEIPDDVRALFEGANYGHVATLLPDGSPHSVPVWVCLEGDRVGFFTQEGSRKARNLARDGRVAISITDHDNPYRMAQIRGRIVDRWDGERALESMDRMSRRYTGADFPVRRGVLFLVEPERVFSMVLPFEHAAG
jgi:PPOX class probable F420-dependent enzyme